MKVKGETRERIIQTAAYLFQLQGYHATASMASSSFPFGK